MVTRGQFLERPALIPVRDVVMEGLSHRGDRRPPLLIIPPPPEEGGSMDHVVAAEAAWAAASRGYPTLRFNFRGVGGSQGERSSGRELLIDAEAALRLLSENTGVASSACLAIGGSAPVTLELLRRHPAVCGLCLVSPVGIEPTDLVDVHVTLRAIVGENDLRQPRVALAAAVTEAGGRFDLVGGADHTFSRNLVDVGSKVAEFLAGLSE
ncbi:MAG TPA: alpha/beta hydrolase [Myxococcaceae bacterium]|nr:alpha/beta hydrolase [Myxococcaceae bacterium]